MIVALVSLAACSSGGEPDVVELDPSLLGVDEAAVSPRPCGFTCRHQMLPPVGLQLYCKLGVLQRCNL